MPTNHPPNLGSLNKGMEDKNIQQHPT
jgi:hypothetical protein